MFNSPSSQEVASFYRQVAVLLRTGLSLPESVTAMRFERDLPHIRGKLAIVEKDLASRLPIDKCLAKHPALFSPALIHAITSVPPGEKLAEVFQKFADSEEKTARIAGKVALILLYPAAVLLVAILIMMVIVVFVIPVFQEMFTDMGGTLPPATQLAIDICNTVHRYFVYIVACLILSVIFLIVNRRFSYAAAARIPIIGASLRKIAIANFAEYLALLLSVGRALPEAWAAAAISIQNLHIGNILRKAGDGISSIGELKEKIADTGLFPVILLTAVERRQTPEALQAAMAETAFFYQAGMEKHIEKNLLLLEIILLLALGTIIGGLVITMYLPIFKMAGTL